MCSINNKTKTIAVGPLQIIKISFSLLSICRDELTPTTKIMAFLPMLPSANESKSDFERESDPIP